MSEYILEMNHITKRFPGVLALNDVSFKVRLNEIHALVGENGAGKSTLMKVLSGIHPFGTYSGDILVEGKVQQFNKIVDSASAGIAIISQELALIPESTIYENIYFGHELMKGHTIDWNKTIVEARRIMEQVGLNEDPSVKVKYLGVGAQQLVEICKAISKNVRVLILDEPTAALNETESKKLLALIKKLRENGVTCILISHRLKEVLEVADTVTVLRDGSTICSLYRDEDEINEAILIKYMVGREINNIFPRRENVDIGEMCFEVKNWSAKNMRTGRDVLKDVNINVRKGEIVGLQGLMGAGRTEFALSIYGNTPGFRLTGGEVWLNGQKVHFHSPGEALRAGVAYVTEDRKEKGLVLIQDIKYNISISNLDALIKGIVINDNEEIVVANSFKDSVNIKAPSVEQKVGNLSGGNQQKVQLAKWLFLSPKLLILDEPTRGIDVGAKFEIYTLMNKLVEQGMSILLISSEMAEILGMSDRIFVMSDGVITAELSKEEATEEKVMSYAVKS